MAGRGGYLRLRQVCLVADDLAREAAALEEVFGLQECHRDPNVARYGLENLLFPAGTEFIEIVSPTREGTAAGRFLARHGGRYGYMVILDCDDPLARQRHCEGIGVRTANVIRHEGYLGVQLHPKDTGGAMIEFNRTVGGEDLRGAYAPAGPSWQRYIRRDAVQRLLAAEVECSDAGAFSSRWGEILGRPVQAHADGSYRIALDSGALVFLPGDGPQAALAGVELQVANREHIVHSARERGCLGRGDMPHVAGIRFRLAQGT